MPLTGDRAPAPPGGRVQRGHFLRRRGPCEEPVARCLPLPRRGAWGARPPRVRLGPRGPSRCSLVPPSCARGSRPSDDPGTHLEPSVSLCHPVTITRTSWWEVSSPTAGDSGSCPQGCDARSRRAAAPRRGRPGRRRPRHPEAPPVLTSRRVCVLGPHRHALSSESGRSSEHPSWPRCDS